MPRRLIGALAVALVALGCAGKKPVIPPEKLWGEAEDAFNIEAYAFGSGLLSAHSRSRLGSFQTS